MFMDFRELLRVKEFLIRWLPDISMSRSEIRAILTHELHIVGRSQSHSIATRWFHLLVMLVHVYTMQREDVMRLYRSNREGGYH